MKLTQSETENGISFLLNGSTLGTIKFAINQAHGYYLAIHLSAKGQQIIINKEPSVHDLFAKF